jgi:hypothetical protein
MLTHNAAGAATAAVSTPATPACVGISEKEHRAADQKNGLLCHVGV